MTATPPQGTPPDVLGDKVNEWLEQDGKLPESEWRKMIAYLLRDMRTDIKEMVGEVARTKEDVRTLKKKNLVIWAERYPRIAGGLLLILGVLIILHAVELWPILDKILAAVAKFLVL